MSTDESSMYSDGRVGLAPSSVMGCFVVIAAIVALPVTVLVGGAYELTRRIDRPNLLGQRGHWTVACLIALAILWFAAFRPRG